MQSEVRVVLSAKLPYAGRDGKMHDASFVVLRAPTSAAYRLAAQIKQEILRAIRVEIERETPLRDEPAAPAAETAPEPTDARPTGREYLEMLATSTADLPLLFDLVRSLVLSHRVALLDGEVPMGPLEVDALPMADFEAIVGEYLATFPRA